MSRDVPPSGAPSRQIQIFENRSGSDVEVHVEMYPDQYVLKSGETMHIEFDHSGNAEDYGLHTVLHPGNFLQIFLEKFDTTIVTINGRKVEPWAKPN